MKHDRIIQLGAAAIALGGVVASGATLPTILDVSEDRALRYTDVSVEGAPPIVAIGNAIGALRGLIVDYLWLKVHIRKQQGQYYEVMADADLITKLQPRFPGVWAFHGHNMAYNISVATHTERERWEWVKAGIDLVRNRGLRYNPDDLELHKELAFWFSHKIEHVNDDAHLYYKAELAREWQRILGEPPWEYEERVAWIKAIADAGDTIADQEELTPGVMSLQAELKRRLKSLAPGYDKKELGYEFLRDYAQYQALTGGSKWAQAMDLVAQRSQFSPYFRAFGEMVDDPAFADAWEPLVTYVRKRYLRDEKNMDAELMYEITRDYGPFDWRHGSSHAFYWAHKGRGGEARLETDDIYKLLNNDRIRIHSMQALSRFGRVSFDLLAQDALRGSMPDVRWIESIDREFRNLYLKYYDARGAGGDSFIDFHVNYMKDAVRQLARMGERDAAQTILDKLDAYYGPGTIWNNPEFRRPLDKIVEVEVLGEYDMQPHLAPADVAGALRYGFVVGLGGDRPEVFQQAVEFANGVRRYFRENDWNNYTTKFGTGRIRDLVRQLDEIYFDVFAQVMTDRSIDFLDRLTIYVRVPEEHRVEIYDRILPQLARELEGGPLMARYESMERILPPPRGIEAFRQQQAAEQERLRREQEESEKARIQGQ